MAFSFGFASSRPTVVPVWSAISKFSKDRPWAFSEIAF